MTFRRNNWVQSWFLEHLEYCTHRMYSDRSIFRIWRWRNRMLFTIYTLYSDMEIMPETAFFH